MTGGLSAAAWSAIPFIDGPLCDGCGQRGSMITPETVVRAPAMPSVESATGQPAE